MVSRGTLNRKFLATWFVFSFVQATDSITILRFCQVFRLVEEIGFEPTLCYIKW